MFARAFKFFESKVELICTVETHSMAHVECLKCHAQVQQSTIISLSALRPVDAAQARNLST